MTNGELADVSVHFSIMVVGGGGAFSYRVADGDAERKGKEGGTVVGEHTYMMSKEFEFENLNLT